MFHVEQDVIVIGGGHAGCEAAFVAARRGARTALLTLDPETVGAMSCNPAIGGVGKGHLVREVDVFGGLIAEAADRAAIHHRMLNRSRGRAVWGPRVQADRRLFARAVQDMLARQPRLAMIAGEAVELLVAGGRVAGIRLSDGGVLQARSIVVASGTFLNGKLHVGRDNSRGGRRGEAASVALAEQLRDLAPAIRLKTGTPPRLLGRSIDWARVALQESDADHWSMAPHTATERNPQLFCGLTRTNAATHAIIAENAAESPLLSGDIEGVGPRYCPSIEDKVRRFGDRDGHQIFLEPEGLTDGTVYPNGISTSLSLPAQLRFVRSIAGLERAEIVQPGYAVEYDALDPRALAGDLQSRDLPGLFLAGQVNGTTGYEEAAAQGLVAGLNAAARALDLPPILFDRAESYTGVMIDDLTLQGVGEPYRMLTARAENRLHLRSDNAEARLFGLAEAAGCLPADRLDAARSRMTRRAALRAGAEPCPDDPIAAEVAETLHYEPYVERERTRADRLALGLAVAIPADLDYDTICGLSLEMRDRLGMARPATIADAQRLRGVSPAAINALLMACRHRAA